MYPLKSKLPGTSDPEQPFSYVFFFFQPPTLPPHFSDGGFSYEEQGFGEICQSVDELVEELCSYLESGCALKEAYRVREDAFFAFGDHENCRRIFEDALEYQRTHR